jgi:16S rRNA (cytosine967-C5)-methyltransferase
VQDRSSQQTGNVIVKSQNFADDYKLQVWDCCAASGGKSIMLADLFEHISLTVSDIRESILQNLKQRFRTAGIQHYTSFISDLSRKQKDLPNAPFDMIVADVPCTGSGTWARTPEQLYFFQEKSLKSFADRQFAIASNCLQWLKPNGHLVYITCSVFASENEEVVQQLVENNLLMLVHDEYITGYLHGADSMYIAILKRR